MLFSMRNISSPPPVPGGYTMTEKGKVSRSRWNDWLENPAGGVHTLQSCE